MYSFLAILKNAFPGIWRSEVISSFLSTCFVFIPQMRLMEQAPDKNN